MTGVGLEIEKDGVLSHADTTSRSVRKGLRYDDVVDDYEKPLELIFINYLAIGPSNLYLYWSASLIQTDLKFQFGKIFLYLDKKVTGCWVNVVIN